MMQRKNIFSILAVLLFVACGADEPAFTKPEGTIFPPEKALGYTPDGSGEPGCSDCDGDGSIITAGFRATVDGTRMEVGEGNVTAIGSVVGGITNLSANLLDGTGMNHVFAFMFRTSPGQYGAVSMQEWFSDPANAGVMYSRAVSGSNIQDASNISGSLTITDTSNGRVSGRFSGQATLNEEEFALQAEFNVRLNQQ